MFDSGETVLLMAVFMGIFGLVAVALAVFIAYILYDGISRIPRSNRTVEPYLAWFTLIPFVGLVFYWILLPFKIPESLKNYFSENPTDNDVVDDYGKYWGLGAVISSTLCIVPFLNLIAWIFALVFLVLFLIQFRKIVALLPQKDSASTPSLVNLKSVAMQPDKFEQLATIKKLFDDGVLNEEEYNVEKKKLLNLA